MEEVVKAIFVPCPNAKHGCTEMFSYGKELVHVKKCSFALCYCPEPNCNYSGIYKDLYSHYDADTRKAKIISVVTIELKHGYVSVRRSWSLRNIEVVQLL